MKSSIFLATMILLSACESPHSSATPDWLIAYRAEADLERKQMEQKRIDDKQATINAERAKCPGKADTSMATVPEYEIRQVMTEDHLTRQQALNQMREIRLQGCYERSTLSPEIIDRAESIANSTIKAVRKGRIPEHYDTGGTLCTTTNIGAYTPYWWTTCRPL